MKLNERIAFHRKRLGLKQRELADKIGQDPSAVGHWERGHTSPRNLEHVVEAGFGMTMSEFWAEASNEEATIPNVPSVEEDTMPDAGEAA